MTRRQVLAAGALVSANFALAAPELLTDEQQEKSIADYFWELFQRDELRHVLGVPMKEPRLNQAMREIARPLMGISTRSGLDWRIGIVDVSKVNALTWGGGCICMHRGLIRLCDSEVELASVIAHEVGHVQYRHAIRRIMAERLFEKIDPHFFEQTDEKMGNAIDARRFETAGLDLIYKTYKRKWEYEADAFSVRALAKTGYDLRGAHRFFEKLLAMKPAKAPLGSCLMASHPETRERIARTKGLVRRYGKQRARPDSDAFEYLKRQV